MKMMLTNVPTTSALWYPNDRSFVAGFIAIFREAMEIANPIRSEAK